MQSKRQLAAILFADIAGYTALMQRDEADALRRLNRYQSVLEMEAGRYHGEVVKNYGDGSIVVFSSAVEAMHCAEEVQCALREEPIVPLRIGIHLGEVVFRNSDVYGDGVNVASRIESIGIPGAILFSKQVSQYLKNQPQWKAKVLGTFVFKNVAEPLEIYALTNEGFSVPSGKEIEGKLAFPIRSRVGEFSSWRGLVLTVIVLLLILAGWIAWKNKAGKQGSDKGELSRSIAVLPFKNLSNDPEQQYFCDGISEDILNALARFPDLKVSGRTSSFQFREENVDLEEISRRLGVDVVLEGSVRKFDNRVRISAQLLDTKNGFQLWADRYDRELTDVFYIQDEIADAIVDNLTLSILPPEKTTLHAINPKAYDAYLKGMYLFNQGEFNKAIDWLESAIQFDPQFAQAYGLLAEVLYLRHQPIGKFHTKETERQVRELIQKGWDLDSTCTEVISSKIFALHDYDFNYAVAQKIIERGIKENPSRGILYQHLAYNTFFQQGKKEKVLNNGEKSVELNPLAGNLYAELGFLYAYYQEWEKIRELQKNVAELFPTDFWGNYAIGIIHYYLGEYDQAYAVFHPLRSVLEENKMVFYYMYYIFALARTGRVDEARERLDVLQSDPAWEVSPTILAYIHLALGERDQAYGRLREALQNDLATLRFIRLDPFWDEVRGETSFQIILRELDESEKGNIKF